MPKKSQIPQTAEAEELYGRDSMLPREGSDADSDSACISCAISSGGVV